MVMLSRSVRFLAITRFSLLPSLSTRRFAPDASAESANVPSMFNVSLSFLAMVSPVLPANFIPSSMVATWISPRTIRVMPSSPLTPGTPLTTPMVPDGAGSPLRPAGPVSPIVPSAPLMLTPEVPSAPFTPMKPSTPSSPSWPAPPTLRSSPNAKSISLSATVVTILPSALVYLTVSPSLTLSLVSPGANEALSAVMSKPKSVIVPLSPDNCSWVAAMPPV